MNETSPDYRACSVVDSYRICLGCRLDIRDRYYCLVGDVSFHVTCFRCCVCSRVLHAEQTCFCRRGQIYCKPDFIASVY